MYFPSSYEIGPGLVPALLRVHGFLISQDERHPAHDGSAGAAVCRPGVKEPLGVRLGPSQEFVGGFRGLLHLLRIVDEHRAAGVHHSRHEIASPRVLQDLRFFFQLIFGEHLVVGGEQLDELFVRGEDGGGILSG